MIAVYMGRTNLGSDYCAPVSLLVVLAWVYYSAQVFLFGAEFTKVYAETFGSQKEHKQSEHTLDKNRFGAEIGVTVSITCDEAERISGVSRAVK
jgi:membrane protein